MASRPGLVAVAVALFSTVAGCHKLLPFGGLATVADSVAIDARAGDRATDAVADVSCPGCCSGGWCWENPLPGREDVAAGADIRALMSRGKTLYAVGQLERDQLETRVLVLRSEGHAWSRLAETTIPAGVNLYDLWVSELGTVFVVGSRNTILWYHDDVWERPTSGIANDGFTLWSVWGSGATDVYAAGNSGTSRSLLHFDGSTWSGALVGPGTFRLFAVWGSSATDVLAVGDNSSDMVILRGAGTTWTPVSTKLGGGQLSAIWGNGASDIYVAGFGPNGDAGIGGRVLHLDAGAWKSLAGGAPFVLHGDVWASTAGDVWVVGGLNSANLVYRLGGGQWLQVSTPDDAIRRAVCGRLTDQGTYEVVVAGDKGSILRYRAGE